MVEVLVTGTFNIVHPDHVRLFEFANEWGAVTVGVNADPYLQKKYGDRAIPLMDRVYVLRSCRYVQSVVVFGEDEPSKLIRKLQPKVYVRGPDYRGVDLIEQPALDEVGARLIIRLGGREHSSSQLVDQLPTNIFSRLNF